MQSAADDGPERASQGRGGPAGVRQGARDPVEERVARAPADEEPRSCGYARPPADAGPPGHPGANPDRPTRSGHRGSSRTACRPARTGGEVRDGYPSGAPLAPSRTVREGGAAPITAVRGRTGGRTAGAVREFRRGGPHRPGGPPPPSDPATRRATSRCPVRRTVTGDRREGTRSSGPAAEIGLEAGCLADRVTTGVGMSRRSTSMRGGSRPPRRAVVLGATLSFVRCDGWGVGRRCAVLGAISL